MNYPDSVAYLSSLLGDIRSASFGLARMEQLTARLGWPQRTTRVIHVAGTNGKGSTAAMIAAGLRAAGRKAGLYTSPHLIRYNERFWIDGRDATDEEFAAAVTEVRAANEWLAAREGEQRHPTLFETVTAAAFCAFRNASAAWSVVEVGLGGRLDATNVADAEIAVITPVDFDHEAFLGKSPEFIAAEKAGILKPGSKAVISSQRPQAAEVIARRCDELGIPLLRAGLDWTAQEVSSREGCYQFEAASAGAMESPARRIPVALPLAGEHQIGNALTAIAALDLAGVEPAAIREGISQTRWPGRLERMPGTPEILLDAAHNPSGAKTLARYLEQHQSGRRIHLIYGAVRDKAVDEVASILFPLVERVVLTRSRISRSISPATLHGLLDHCHERIETADTVEQAIGMARRNALPGDLILIAGSIFLVGEAKESLESASVRL